MKRKMNSENQFRAPAETPRARGANERNKTMEITQKEINALADKIGKVPDLIREVNAMAFNLAKAGNANGVFQLRGAFSGALQAAQMADGFLSGLVAIVDR